VVARVGAIRNSRGRSWAIGHAVLNGEPEAARLPLRDLVNATVGFEALAETMADFGSGKAAWALSDSKPEAMQPTSSRRQFPRTAA
jgi:hypothetical protein